MHLIFMAEHPSNEQGSGQTDKRKSTFGVPKLREKILDALSQAYVNNLLDTEEYEKRVEGAHQSKTVEELAELVHDFPDKNGIIGSFTQQPAQTPPRSGERTTTYSRPEMSQPTMPPPSGNRELKGLTIIGNKYLMARECANSPGFAFTGIGDLVLDLRDIKPGQVVDMTHISLIGDLKVLLPEGVSVEQNYLILIGEIKRRFRRKKNEAAGTPRKAYLRITGIKLIGDLKFEYY